MPPREPSKTKVVAFFQTDLGGLLPQSVVDAFFPRSMAGFYANLRKAVRSVLPRLCHPSPAGLRAPLLAPLQPQQLCTFCAIDCIFQKQLQ